MENILKSYNPSNGEIVGELEITPIDKIDEIVENARIAQKSWKELSVDKRIQYIEKASQKVNTEIESLAILLSKEMGKDYRRSYGEVNGSAQGAPYYARQVKEAIQTRKVSGGKIQYKPLGVVAVISPWNYPLAMATNLIIPALVAGNTVVFKPSEETPLIAKAYVDILNQYLPENVIQIVIGDSNQGKKLVDSNIHMVAFTGSQKAGKDIMKRASNSLKRLVMELGGNDPMIVLEDAHIDSAARFAVASSFENAGQMCTSTERIYVHESIAERFEERVVQFASHYTLGPWNQQNVNIGPIINEKQRSKIINHIEDAVSKGAKVLLGGKDHPEHYISPTVLTNIHSNMLMEKEETFGPVVSISKYDDLEEAIQKANDSEYGLGAVVYGAKEAQNVAEKLEAGMVAINGSVGAGGDAPWVGAKQSGFGYHGSIEGHRQFTQVKVIS
ncbi:aldehyde dehydrogenase family protein [Aureivirga sp. CE67]|uniref:aldehyde dehydrogenase family protein n=1 Tax=Aureivirga sp. CE67 TaxID=1788983 RepID=UPI0018CAFE6D|nr:aldehyde dehydrogenase family protein [Aureivirga sp. CE67]